jgi:hypothetical protein
MLWTFIVGCWIALLYMQANPVYRVNTQQEMGPVGPTPSPTPTPKPALKPIAPAKPTAPPVPR